MTATSVAKPTMPMQAETISAIHVQHLKLRHKAIEVAALLYQAARLHIGEGHPDYPPVFGDSPLWIREEMLRQAERAVMATHNAHEREAERVATLALLSLVDETADNALNFHQFKELIRRLKPFAAALSVYRTSLSLKGGR